MSRNLQAKSNASNQVPKSSSSSTNNRAPPQSSSNNRAPAARVDPIHLRENFLKKVEFCTQTFDFNDDTKDTQEKAQRLKYLEEIIDLFNDKSMMNALILPNLGYLIELIEKNLFRPLPEVEKKENEDPESSEASWFPPSWPHLQPVFELFLQIILSDQVEMNLLKKFITQVFVQEFLELFDSEVSIKREYAKNTLHRLYSKLVPRRKMLRKAITDCFYTLIHENFKLNGAAELLDILASIISGFAVPLREEHVYFFKTVIIPLHKVQTCQFYHEQLLRCSMLFLSKDPTLSIPLVEGLLKFWPFGNSAKETAFLTELLEVLEVCDLGKLEPLIPRLFKRLIKCISGPQLQVADRAMCFFENDYFLSVLKTYKNQTFPLLVPVICAIADTHWHKVLQESLNALKTILKEIDSGAFEKALLTKDSKVLYLVQDPKILKKERAKVDEKWKMLTKQAQMKNFNFEEPIVPYTDTHIVGEFNGLNNGNISF